MPIEVKCSCGKTLSVAESLQGTRGACPFCGAEIDYPAREKKTSRIVISIGEQTAKIEARGTSRVVGTTKLSDLDDDAKKKVLRAIVLCIAAVIAISLSFYLHSHWQTEQYNESRDGVFVALQQAEDNRRQGSPLKAWTLYEGIKTRIKWYLREVDPEDAELLAKLAEIEKIIAELTSGGGIPKPGAGDLGGRNPGGGANPGAGPVAPVLPPVNQKDLAALLAEDPTAIYLGIPASVAAGDFTVVGLGLHPDDSPEKLVEIWGEPGRKKPVLDEPDHEEWSFQSKDGFDVQVRLGSSELGSKDRVDRINVYPNFTGTVNGFRVEGTTPTFWRRTVGGAEEGSTDRFMRYRAPFSGWVSFDEQGKFTKLRISFQLR